MRQLLSFPVELPGWTQSLAFAAAVVAHINAPIAVMTIAARGLSQPDAVIK
jgi:hypothetical protein